MSELRGTAADAPDRSSDVGRRLIGAEIQRLDALGNQRAADPSRPVYDPLAHVDASKQVESVSRVDAARIRAEDAADDVADARAERPKWTLDTPLEPGDEPETAGDVLKRHCGGELSAEDAKALADYIKDNKADKPILAVVENEHPLVQKVYLDQVLSGGHHTERHEGWRDDLSQAERARMAFDPAHPTDSLEYYRSANALRPGEDKPHVSADQASRIHDPVAYTVAMAKAMEHPEVKAALETPFQQGVRPDEIDNIRIDDLLGPKGHEACSGFRLVGADAFADRQTFVRAVRAAMPVESSIDPRADHQTAAEKVNEELDLPVPEVEVIPSFEGGTVMIVFRAKADESGYEILTFYPVAQIETPADGQEK